MADIYDQLLDEETETATAAPQADVYDQLLDADQKAQDRQLQVSLDQALAVAPERAATAQELAKASGLPEDVVERNFQAVDKHVKARQLQSLMSTSPILARQMADPNFAKIAQQDVEQLSGVEKAFAAAKDTGRAALSGLYSANQGIVGLAQMPFDVAAPLFDPLTGTVLPENPMRRVLQGLSSYRQGIKAQADALMPKADGILGAGYYSGIASLSRNLAALPLALLPGGQAAALTAMTAPVAGQEYGDARDQGLGVGQALSYGASQAVIEYATERLPLSRLLGDLKAGTPFYQLVARQMLLEVPGEQIATVLQDLNEWAVLNPDQPFSAYLAERPSAAAQTLIATVVGTGGQVTVMRGLDAAVRRATGERAQAEQAEQRARLLEELNRLAAASDLQKRDAGTFEQFVERASQDGPVQDVYIDANLLMQSGLAEQLAAVSPSVAEQLETAALSGGSVQIPVAEYAARIAPTDFAQPLLDHLKTDPEGMSRIEAQAYLQEATQRFEQDFEQTMATQQADDAARASVEVVRDNVKAQLDAANRFTPQVNDAYAALVGEFYANVAARGGMTAEQMYERYPLRVVAEGAGGGQQFDQAAIDTPAFREWFGDSQVVDTAGKPLVVYHGTNTDFEVFQKPEVNRMSMRSGVGFWFATDAADAGKYGSSVMPVYINIKKPRRITQRKLDEMAHSEPMADVLKKLRRGGYDGLYVEPIKADPALDEPGQPAQWVAFKPEQIKSATGNRGTFDPNDPNILNQGARGFFNPETNTIGLLKAADLSTFLHESGHFFLEVQLDLAAQLTQQAQEGQGLTEGEQQIVADAQALLDWFGVTDLTTWYNLDFEEKRSYHEQFARGFEAYLFEGNAPSIEMQGIFQRFRTWLVNVYKNLQALNVELTNEVRSVMDRMVATDEQIKAAEYARSMMPLFESPEQAGMTPDEFAAYQALGQDATWDAQQQLSERGLRDMQWLTNGKSRELKRLQKAAEARRAEERMDARREVMSQPVYRAWQFLTGKVSAQDRVQPQAGPKSDPNIVDPSQDSLFVAIAKLGGIQRDQAQSEWGVDPKEKIAQPVFGKPVLRKTGGLTLDEMRQALGQLGYLQRDQTSPDWQPNEFEWKFFDELGGSTVYSNQYDYGAAQQDELAGQGVNLEGVLAGRLSRPELRAEYGDADDAVWKALDARRMVVNDGLHPDLVAELFGFTSGDELVQALARAQPPDLEIEALTDLRMLERHGDLATPEALSRAADAAIHNDLRARVIAAEHQALAAAVGPRVATGTDARGRTRTAALVPQAARQFASTMVSRLKIRNLRPGQYTAAETRAAKAAERALREGDLEQAAAEKRNQLVNTYAAKATHAAMDEVDTALRYLKKFDSEGTRKNLDVDYLDQIDTLLERFDLRRGQSLRAIDKRTSLAEWVAEQEQAGIEPDIPAYLLHEANRQHYKNMTLEEFRGLVDTVRQVEHIGRLKKRLLTAKDQRDLDAVVNEIQASIVEASGGRTVDNERRDVLSSKLAHAFRGALATHRKAASVVREMDGFQDGGPLWEYFTRTMNEAGDREADMRADAARRLHALSKSVIAGGPMGGKGKSFPSLGRSLNRGERLAIALNWGNESNRQRLMGGKEWTAAQLQPVLDSLTATEWQFVQGVWDFFESYRPQIAAKERRVMGKEPEWIEAAPFTIRTADGQDISLRGGYYPVKYDPNQSGKAGEFAEAEEAKTMMRAAHTASTTRRSFTKARAEEVKGRPLLLTFDGIWQGANEVIHDLAWHEWLIDANKLLRRLDGTIRTRYGAEYMDVLRNAVKDTARGDIPAANTMERSLNHVRTGATVAGLGWNLTTALLQPLGLTQSIVRVGGKWIARGLSQYYGSPLHMLEKAREVRAKSPMMENRALTMNREINDVRNRLAARSDWGLKLEASFFVFIQKVQAGVDYPTWLGAYEKAIAAGQEEDRAIALADQAVIDSQGSGQIKDLAQIQRGHPAMKLFTNFYSYFSTLMNLTTEQTRARLGKKQYAALAGDYVLLLVLPAVLGAVLRNVLKGEDDEDKYLEDILSELVGYPFGMFVGLREMAGAAQALAGVGGPFQYGGPAGLRLIGEIERLAKQIDQGEPDMALFKAANNTAGILFHYPAGQVNRLVEGAAALIEGKTANPLAPLAGVRR